MAAATERLKSMQADATKARIVLELTRSDFVNLTLLDLPGLINKRKDPLYATIDNVVYKHAFADPQGITLLVQGAGAPPDEANFQVATDKWEAWVQSKRQVILIFIL